MPIRLTPQPDDRLSFFGGFVRDPQQVGSIIPSSRFLERKLVAHTEASRARTIVELGPGTGGTSRALLRAMPADGTLLSIEIEERFVRLLNARNSDGRFVAHHGSATDLVEILAERGLPAPDCVVSGIPFSTMPPAIGHAILAQVRTALAPGGSFVAYQVRDRVAKLGREHFGEPETVREFRNIPPMRLYRWRKTAEH